MNPKPLLPIFENESPEEKAERGRQLYLEALQPRPDDSRFVALKKWLIRNRRPITLFGLLGAILIGLKLLNRAPQFADNTVNGIGPYGHHQGHHIDNAVANLLRDMDLAESRRQLAQEMVLGDEVHDGSMLDPIDAVADDQFTESQRRLSAQAGALPNPLRPPRRDPQAGALRNPLQQPPRNPQQTGHALTMEMASQTIADSLAKVGLKDCCLDILAQHGYKEYMEIVSPEDLEEIGLTPEQARIIATGWNLSVRARLELGKKLNDYKDAANILQVPLGADKSTIDEAYKRAQSVHYGKESDSSAAFRQEISNAYQTIQAWMPDKRTLQETATKILQVPFEADRSAIDEAYHKLGLKHCQSGPKRSPNAMRAINAAHIILCIFDAPPSADSHVYKGMGSQITEFEARDLQDKEWYVASVTKSGNKKAVKAEMPYTTILLDRGEWNVVLQSKKLKVPIKIPTTEIKDVKITDPKAQKVTIFVEGPENKTAEYTIDCNGYEVDAFNWVKLLNDFRQDPHRKKK